MKKFMQLLFLSCLRATGLIEKKMLFRIGKIENMQLKAHKMLCRVCSNYEKQSLLLEKGISNFTKTETSEQEMTQLKRRIIQELDGKD